MANWLERALASVAPGTAAKRAIDRRKFELVEGARAYDGASRGRRTQGWRSSITSADAELSVGGALLRQRSRDLVRNNPYATKIVTTHADNIVGSGITPRAATDNPALNETLDKLFANWAKKASPDGMMDFYSMQYLACREMIEGGDVIAKRQSAKGGPIQVGKKPEDQIVPLRVRLLEAEYLDSSKNGAGKGNTIIVNGVEIDKDGGRKGYWIYPQHPGAAVTNSKLGRESKRFSPDEIAHLYEMQRQQVRGAPWLAPIMIGLRDLDDYNQSELIRKKIESCVVGVVISGVDDDDPNIGLKADGSDETGITDSNGYPIDRFEPGMITYAKGGKDIRFNNPAISAGIETYLRAQLRRLSAGARLPYELMTGDLSQANYSSNRMGIQQYWRFVDHVQWHIMIPLFCQVVWDWFIQDCRLLGVVKDDIPVPAEWSPPAREAINPLDDVRADILEVRAGFRSMQEVIGERGRTHSDVVKEIVEWNQKIDGESITLDTDPRHVSMNGQLQFESSGSQSGDGGNGPASSSKGKANKQGKNDGKKA